MIYLTVEQAWIIVSLLSLLEENKFLVIRNGHPVYDK